MPRASARVAAIPTVALDEPVDPALGAGGAWDLDWERPSAPSCADTAVTPGSERDGRGLIDRRGAASGDPESLSDTSMSSMMAQLLASKGRMAWNISIAVWNR